MTLLTMSQGTSILYKMTKLSGGSCLMPLIQKNYIESGIALSSPISNGRVERVLSLLKLMQNNQRMCTLMIIDRTPKCRQKNGILINMST